MNNKCENCRYYMEKLKPTSTNIMDCIKKKNPLMNKGKCKTFKKKFNPELAKLKKELNQRYAEASY